MTDVPSVAEVKLSTYSVIVADDDARVCDALAELLADDPRFMLVGTCHSGVDAATLASSHLVDLAVVDIQMPTGGIEAIAAIHAVSPHTRVAVFSAKRGSRVRAEMIGAGAVAFFNKGEAVDLSGALLAVLDA